MTPSLGLSSSIQPRSLVAKLPGIQLQHAQGDSSTKGRPQASQQQSAEMFWPAVASLCWTFCSSGLILLNKELMVADGFNFPMTLTAAGQLTSYVGGKIHLDPYPHRNWLILLAHCNSDMRVIVCYSTECMSRYAGLALARIGFMSCRPRPTIRFFLKRLLPIVLLSALSLVSGNMAYTSLSVAFIQVLKVLLPAITLIVSVAAGVEHLTAPLAVSVILITAGTGYAAVLESQSGHFSSIGLAQFLLSAVCEGSRTVLVQLLLGQMKYNAVEALVYLSPCTGSVLAVGALLWEREGLAAAGGGLYKVSCKPHVYLLAAAGGFLVNLTTFWAIKATSGLTFKVLGCVKNSFVVWAGVLLGDSISGQQLCGYAVSLAGFLLYSRAKVSSSSVKHE